MSQRFVIPVVIALSLLAACGAPEEKTYSVRDPETGEKTKITVREDGAGGSGEKRVVIENKEGGAAIVVGEGAAPANLPAYLPAYPGATWQASMSATAAGGTGGEAGGMAAFTTKDAPGKVLDHYKTAFARAGMKEAASGQFGEMSMVAARKEGSNEGAQVMVTKAENGETSVQLIFSLAP
jgi:hypothetical protein